MKNIQVTINQIALRRQVSAELVAQICEDLQKAGLMKKPASLADIQFENRRSPVYASAASYSEGTLNG